MDSKQDFICLEISRTLSANYGNSELRPLGDLIDSRWPNLLINSPDSVIQTT